MTERVRLVKKSAVGRGLLSGPRRTGKIAVRRRLSSHFTADRPSLPLSAGLPRRAPLVCLSPSVYRVLDTRPHDTVPKR